MAVSVKDVAEAAGVSLGTVSHVLNHPERVSERNRRRVEQAILQLGYVRNDVARQLRSGSSKTIALILLETWNPFFNDLARGVEDVATESGWAVLAANSAREPARESSYLNLFSERRVEGMIVIPTAGVTEQLRGLRAKGIASVIADHYEESPDQVFVSFDDVLGGQLATAHLIELGHRRIGFVGTSDSVEQVKQRFRGAAAAAAGSGVYLSRFTCGQLTLADGQNVASRVLAMPEAERPTALFAANDLLALGILQVLLNAGVRVPDDIALVGYDDIEFARYAAVPLSSVVQPAYQMGRKAADLLFMQLTRQLLETTHVVFEPHLVVRESSGPSTAMKF